MKFSIVELAIVGLLLAFIGDAMQINWKSPQILSFLGWNFLNIAYVWLIWIIYKEIKKDKY